MTMQHEMMNMFATPLYRSSLQRAFTQTELDCFRSELGDSVAAIANFSSRNKRVLDKPELEQIRLCLQEHLDAYFKTVFDTANDVRLLVTQSWLTLSRQGESHHAHTHPNSVVSGVLYINLAPSDGISFHRNEDNIWHELLPAQENYFNAKSYFVNTQVGDIVLFPSHVKHGVREVKEDVERVSLSFNSFFSGNIGREEFANALTVSLT